MDHLDCLKQELREFYGGRLHAFHERSMKQCEEALSNGIPQGLSAVEQKMMQYEILSRTLTPVLFRNTRLFGEVCANDAQETAETMGNRTLKHNMPAYRRYAASVLEEKNAAASYPLYTFCGEFGDETYHFAFDNGVILKQGFHGVYDRATRRLEEPGLSVETRNWLEAVRSAVLAVKTVADRFAGLAAEYAKQAESEAGKEHFLSIAKTAAKVPWEKPGTFVEALTVIQFIQSVIPALEGGGLYSVGRLDLLLIDFYRNDLETGIITEEDAERYVGEFFLLHDLRIPHDRAEQGDSLVNAVYTLGGVDREGRHVFNELTRMFLKVDRELDIIYPKIKCRYDADSPGEYLDLINAGLRGGKSTLLYQNDKAMIPALVRAGIDIADARDYSVLGCWEPVIPGCTNEHCSYFLTLKIFELSLYGGTQDPHLPFTILPLDGAGSFEEVLSITLRNIHTVMESRCRVAVSARRYWHLVDPRPLTSSVLDDCLAKGRDLTDGGTRYSRDEIICAGLPNVIDSLLAIKELCFDRKKYTLGELLDAVRNDWENEDIRREALQCHFFGDESDESSGLMRLVTDDFASFAETLPALWGGRVTVGYMLFMEMYRMAENIRATPDGRHSGDFFSRGLTPSNLHPSGPFTSVINCFEKLDATGMAANSVVNVTAPLSDVPLSVWETMIRCSANSALQALQINCASREELLDAIEHPERHQSLIVRVCGYSARFVSLPAIVQQDFLQRNFYKI